MPGLKLKKKILTYGQHHVKMCFISWQTTKVLISDQPIYLHSWITSFGVLCLASLIPKYLHLEIQVII